MERGAFSYRADPSVPSFPDDKPVIVFDGHCVMCSGWARFVLRHDPYAVFRLLPAQTPLGRAIYAHYRLDPEDYETNILLSDGRAWFKSQSSLRMARALGGPWRWLADLLDLLPDRWLDWAYDAVAGNRLRLFGRREVCYLTEPGQADRFLA